MLRAQIRKSSWPPLHHAERIARPGQKLRKQLAPVESLVDVFLNRLDLYQEKVDQLFGGGESVQVVVNGSTLLGSLKGYEEVIEPFLIQQGLLMRTPRGRALTRDTYNHLGLTAPQNQTQFDLLVEQAEDET